MLRNNLDRVITRTRVLATALAAMLLLNATRAVADPAPPPDVLLAASTLPWNGWYAGAHAGYSVGAANSTLTDSSVSTTESSFGMLGGGLQVGYARLLRSHLLLGLELSASVPNFLENNDRLSFNAASAGLLEEKVDVRGAVRARLGYRFRPGLVYGTAGFAWSEGRFMRVTGGDQGDEEHWRTHPGLTLGAGVEYALAANWTARFEYRNDRLESAGAAFTSGPSLFSTVSVNSAFLGLNWYFSGPGESAPRPPTKAVMCEGGASDGAPELAARGSRSPADPPRNARLRSEVVAPVAGKHGSDSPERTQVRLHASDVADEAPAAWDVHGQTTVVGQGYPSFRSPYAGAQSLSGASQFKNTVSATAFLGLRLWQGGELYFNPEIMQGFGLSDVRGIAAFPNGEAQKSDFLIPRFNAARIFLSQTFALGDEQEVVEDAANQLPGKRSVSRLTVSAGKFAVTDFFLTNSYAGEPRTGFLNWNIYGGGSYDWTMDRLSWTWGALADFNEKSWALRAGYFLLPVQASTDHFDTRVPNHGQYTAELELRATPFGKPGKAQLFGWLSYGNIGSYGDALAQPAATPSYPDVNLTRGHDRFNYGFVLGAEQALAGDLGAFSRASWSPERVESMGWTDCGESFSLGATLKGTFWRRSDDTVGLAGVIQGLSSVTRRYLAAGGMGILIGDGRLNYRPETALEVYYSYALLKWLKTTLDYQFVVNPGYNADRGPVSLFAVRLHAEF